MWTPDDDYSMPSNSIGIQSVNYPDSQQWQHPSFLNRLSSGMQQYGTPQARRRSLLSPLAARAGQGGFLGGLGTVAKFFL